MFTRHVTKDLSAYCHRELAPSEAQRFAGHLIACVRCRTKFEEIKLGIKFAEQLPQYSAPSSIWPELDRLCASQTEVSESMRLKTRRAFWQLGIAAVAGLILVATGLGVFLIFRDGSQRSWEVARLDGTPRIGSSAVGSKGLLAVGQWLETDGSSRARIQVSSIGQVEIDPNTRVRLVQTQPTEHRLELARGRMSARIWAPPRLFFVDTPSAVAADLGCAYTLEVNDEGGSLLQVTSGWVALQSKGRESIVPAGAACRTQRGVGPGTPYFEDASESFRAALARFDFESVTRPGETTAPLRTVLSEARQRDSLTVWHLLFRVDLAMRGQIYQRLAELAPPPPGVSRDGVMQLNHEMLDLWKNDLEKTWTNSTSARGSI